MTYRGIGSLFGCSLVSFTLFAASALAAPGGDSRVIRSIGFEGNHAFTAEQLMAGFDRVKPGVAYDPDLVDLELETRIRPRYRKQGFIYATAEQSVRAGDSQSVDLVIHMDEGYVYRYGSIRIEGGETMELGPLFGQLPGDLVNWEELQRGFLGVRRLLEERGCLDGEVIPEMKPDHASGTVALTVSIVPGRPYLVGRVNFTNSASEAIDKRLREVWLLEPGGLFRSSLLKASIARVNELHLFLELTEADCEVIKRPEPQLVDVLVRPRPR